MTTRDDSLEVPMLPNDWEVIAFLADNAACDATTFDSGIALGLLAAKARQRARLLRDGIVIP